MSRVRVACFGVSIDGYGAGPDQDREHPLGVGGERLHRTFVATRTFRAMFGQDGGTTGVDDDFARRGIENLGAWILGRNMFSPMRGPWRDDTWRGWWGDEPPYHVPVFVLTHHPRASFETKGGTTFHFVTEGPEEALRRAKEAAGGKDVRIGGGAATIRQYLQRRLVDDVHLVISPVLLGRGEHLLSGIDLVALGYRVDEHVAGDGTTHVVIGRERAE
jgi:dihydrofolate reductase